MQIKIMVRKIEEYVEKNKDDLPILRECCLENGWDFSEFCKHYSSSPSLKRAADRLLSQQIVNLEKNSVMGSFNKAMSVFLLERLYENRELDLRESALVKLDALLSADAAAADGRDAAAADEDDGIEL
jgi:hypothetical protein